MIDTSLRISNRAYRHVFLVQNRDYWKTCLFEYDKAKDLVLSFDFAVVNMIKIEGGEAQYIDHIVDSETMEAYNYKTYDFFSKWHCDAANQDIFNYRGIDVGSAFRIEIWNDVTFYVRIFINLHELFKRIKYETVYSGIDVPVVIAVLKFLKIEVSEWIYYKKAEAREYYFPIFKYLDEAINPSDFRYKVRVFVLSLFDRIFNQIERFKKRVSQDKFIYIEWYHPTHDIILEFKKTDKIKMVRSDFNGIRDIFNGVHLPIFVSAGNSYKHMAIDMLKKFDNEKCAVLFIDSIDISNELYKLIIKRISPLVAKSLKLIDVILRFFTKKQPCLMITISSNGVINRLMINYCKKNNIPIYMIINGLIANSFLDESKDGTWINSYGESIKKNYFKGMNNIICLGDPRMDKYFTSKWQRQPDYNKLTIGIGTSAFSNVDLNSHLAVEFEFLNDIMIACKKLIEMGRNINIIIKARQNNYIQQYNNFLEEYYPDMPVTILHNVSMMQVYEKVDFYISTTSQTLFEASCLGIPVLYYKNDTHFYHTPFDGKSELVTAFTPEDLVKKIEAFYNGDKIYDAFKEKKNLEKYIGPLDGQNLKRNMDFIYSLCLK